jgi:hypothetical protein
MWLSVEPQKEHHSSVVVYGLYLAVAVVQWKAKHASEKYIASIFRAEE